jgi:hypothetical protein
LNHLPMPESLPRLKIGKRSVSVWNLAARSR